MARKKKKTRSRSSKSHRLSCTGIVALSVENYGNKYNQVDHGQLVMAGYLDEVQTGLTTTVRL